jgi:hypothetical protein
MIKVLSALLPSGEIMIQISEDEKALAHVKLNREQALELSTNITKLVEMLPQATTTGKG